MSGARSARLVAQGFGLAAPFWVAFAGMAVLTTVAWRPLAHVEQAGRPDR